MLTSSSCHRPFLSLSYFPRESLLYKFLSCSNSPTSHSISLSLSHFTQSTTHSSSSQLSNGLLLLNRLIISINLQRLHHHLIRPTKTPCGPYQVSWDTPPGLQRCASARGRWSMGVRGPRAEFQVADMAWNFPGPWDGCPGPWRGRHYPAGSFGMSEFRWLSTAVKHQSRYHFRPKRHSKSSCTVCRVFQATGIGFWCYGSECIRYEQRGWQHWRLRFRKLRWDAVRGLLQEHGGGDDGGATARSE